MRVVVRCRPLNSTEVADGRGKAVHMDTNAGSITLVPYTSNERASEPPKTFTFDQVYDENSTQEYIYQQTASRIVDSVLEGFNGTIFAYGQTGTGKTFTMEGAKEPASLLGIIPRAFQQIFEEISSRGGANTEFLVRASYLEIYNEEIRCVTSCATPAPFNPPPIPPLRPPPRPLPCPPACPAWTQATSSPKTRTTSSTSRNLLTSVSTCEI